ncbi:hypothetical protein Bbelb_102910 [Branchiostoma belcheri]|nr:hypothetical protein Bbelb_102910 [Branchiostoma belcheri]
MAVTFKDDPKWRPDQPSDDTAPYKTLLQELGKDMRDDDLEIVKFMFKEDVGESVLEKVTSPLELFEVLEDHGKIGPPNNLSKLEEGMRMAGREDLVTKIKEYSAKCADAARQARRRKDTPWVSKSPFAAANQPQVVGEEEEEDEEETQDTAVPSISSNSDASASRTDVTHSSRRLSTIPEDGPKRPVLPPINKGVIEEEPQQPTEHAGEATNTSKHQGKGQEKENNSSTKKTSSKDIPATTSGKKKSSLCVLL